MSRKKGTNLRSKYYSIAGIEESVAESVEGVGKALEVIDDGRRRIPTIGERCETERMIEWRKHGSET